MDKILVTVFADEGAAFDGLDALRDLHFKGDITLHSSTIIAKRAGAIAQAVALMRAEPT
ncbi:MAG TPA: hypothetical protein VIK08_00425 [Candidatus Limnocylindrales bacterium]